MAEPRKRRRLEPDARREQIFACALRLFAECAYSSVSTGDIAAEAGVARGLIDHYFGTKRELYLSVVRELVTMPPLPEVNLPAGSDAERARAGVDWFLDFVWGNRQAWIGFVGFGASNPDPDLQEILLDAEDVCADRIFEAIGFAGDSAREEPLRAAVRAFSGMVRSALAEWLVRGSLSREQVHILLTSCLTALVTAAFPAMTS